MTMLNLNADLGESFGAYRIGNDHQLLPLINSANIASGFHAGDPWVMHETLELAKKNGVSVGVHPSFPDLQGFGRRRMQIEPRELEAIILYQIGALDGVARAHGVKVTHTKPHGALGNMACEDRDLAMAIARAVKAYDAEMILLAPVFSELAAAGEHYGLPVALEVFADRAYTDAGMLVSRKEPDAVHHTSAACVNQVERMLDSGGVVCRSGKILPCSFHSICVHGDNEESVATAAQIRTMLESRGCQLLTLPEMKSQF